MIPFWPARPSRIWPDSAVFQRLVSDPTWAVEPKLDGYRCIIEWTDAGIFGWSRHGKSLVLRPDLRCELERLEVPVGTAVDGELLGTRVAGSAHRFVAFDVPFWEGTPDAVAPLDARRARLVDLGFLGRDLATGIVPWLPNAFASFDYALGAGNEGVVLKRRDAAYPFAFGPVEEPNTTAWFKVKAPTFNGRLVH